jgi:hypothetical protein
MILYDEPVKPRPNSFYGVDMNIVGRGGYVNLCHGLRLSTFDRSRHWNHAAVRKTSNGCDNRPDR